MKIVFYIILIPWSNFKRNKCFELFSYAKFWKEEFEAGNNKWRHIGRSYRLERRGEHEIVSWLYAAIACIRCYSSWYWKNLYNFVSFIHVKITLTWLIFHRAYVMKLHFIFRRKEKTINYIPWITFVYALFNFLNCNFIYHIYNNARKKQLSNNGYLHQRIFSHFLQVHLQMSLLMFYIDGNIFELLCVCVCVWN